MRIIIAAALLLPLPLSASAQPRPQATAGVAMMHAFNATASPAQADRPSILESAARLATEVQLQQPGRQGNRQAIQRIPLPVQIAMVAGGSVLFYLALRQHGDCGCSSMIWAMTGTGAAVALGTGLMLQ